MMRKRLPLCIKKKQNKFKENLHHIYFSEKPSGPLMTRPTWKAKAFNEKIISASADKTRYALENNETQTKKNVYIHNAFFYTASLPLMERPT